MNTGETTPQMVGLSLLQGQPITNPQGQTLAHLKELLADVQSGRISYAVVTVSETLNMGQRMLAVPWAAFHIDPQRPKLVLDMDVERIRDAPFIDERNWPADWPGRHDRNWHLQTHQFYGVKPDADSLQSYTG